ncbi:response regulator [Paenibacillus septentrionalis]|uniref:Response regulator n=1 Tax=Paenibacillus septentrionalis TaxID=429342 RepID=A0ABW1V5T3_9BACL
MLRVLLVDDETFFRQGLRAIVDWQSCGYEVIGEEDNGEDAFHFIVRERPDVVITDIRMPEIDGLELIHKVVQQEKLKTKFIIVSGYDEFKYAQQAVKYGVCDFLLKPIDESGLEETLKQIAETIERESRQNEKSITHHNQELLSQLELGTLSESQLLDIYDGLDLDPKAPHYFILLEYHYVPGSGRKQEAFTYNQLQQIIHTIQSILPSLGIKHMFPQRGQLGVVVPQALIKENSSIHMVVRHLYNRLAEEHQLYIYYSKKCTGVHFLQEAYQGALHAAQFKYIDDRALFDYAELKELELRTIMLPSDSYKELLNEIEANHEEGIEAELDALIAQFGKQRCSVEAVKATIHKLVADCLHIVQTMQIDKGRLSHLHELIGWESNYMNRATLRELLLSFALDCSRCIAEERKEMAKGGIQRIKKYIDQHYAEPISLKSIAARFYINPVYLGQLFKKNYHLYFNEYLLQLRIQEAKKLLRQTDLKIYEIAERVGFSHPEYFVSQFEKQENLSPTAYRQTFKNGINTAGEGQ